MYKITQIVPSISGIPGLNAISILKSRDWKKAPELGPLETKRHPTKFTMDNILYVTYFSMWGFIN